MIEGWRSGRGTLFAQPFSENAHFVAFDGSVHEGPEEISVFHQKAFDTVLKGTTLELAVTDIKQVDEKVWLFFTNGWHRSQNASGDQRKAESVNILVCKMDETRA